MERVRLKVRLKESVSSYQPLFVEIIRDPEVCITMHSIPLHQSWVHQVDRSSCAYGQRKKSRAAAN
ncbi:hypothetical protein C5167_050961 [Papaver somniferum]|uniref:Uncharacterized protein n=1 Tax=Papaver somniferum TaxID=3469 RepID=A0A4Y7KTI9_PAPSO|nr:hypothetical protein C5167_050961 [Papaver somniferum]